MSGVRLARPVDAQAIAAVEVETWRTTYAGILPDEVLVGLSVDGRTRHWRTELERAPKGIWVWRDNSGAISGFGQCGRQRDLSLPFQGEISMLYVQTDAQNNGIGRQLLLALLATLLASDCRTILTWVLRSNPSRYFYDHMGARALLERQIPVAGHLIDAVGYGWDDPSLVLDRWVRSGHHWAP